MAGAPGANAPIIVKKKKGGGGHGHHGGAWKVAYADFVTAMMAFFLMLWLISTTTPEQKRGIAEYFAPASISKSQSGAGGVLGGTAFVEDGSRHAGSNAVMPDLATPQPNRAKQDSEGEGKGGAEGESEREGARSAVLSEEAIDKALAEREAFMFQQAEMSLRQAMQDLPDLAELSKHIIIDQTPEGMRIQLVDQEGRAMFAQDGSEPLPHTVKLLGQVARVVDRLPNRIKVTGHTDSRPLVRSDGTGIWELSAERANAARRVLARAGIDSDRVHSVAGRADAEPLYVDDPFAAANRRISIVLLREAPVLPPGHAL